MSWTKGQIEKNYSDYLKQPQRIGFTQSFPVVEVLDEMRIRSTCRRFDVEFKVQHVRVSFGEEKQFTCEAVVTDRVDIARKLPLGGFGSHAYADEAETMEQAVVDMCKQKEFIISEKICSWPFAKAIITKIKQDESTNKRAMDKCSS